MTLVLATANKNKILEMTALFGGLGVDVKTQAELGLKLDPEETGLTFFDNAVIKARAICEASGYPAVADDSGLVVDCLGGEPGVFSKRYGGGNLSDSELCRFLLKKMEASEHRAAKFVSCIACAFPDGRIVSAEGECQGSITRSAVGTNGFGYDPVFYVDSAGKTMAEMTQDEKNLISHRGNATRLFRTKLEKFIKDIDIKE